MEALVPGSQLAIDLAPTGEPLNSKFSTAQLQTIIHSGIDRFMFMYYGLCGHHYSGWSNSGLPFIQHALEGVVTTMGIPTNQMVAMWPWFGCDFVCPPGGCHLLKVDCGGVDCKHNGTGPGIAQIQPLLAQATATGYNTTYPSPWFEYTKEITVATAAGVATNPAATMPDVAALRGAGTVTAQQGHIVWYDDERSLLFKHRWALENQSFAGVGIWTPGKY